MNNRGGSPKQPLGWHPEGIPVYVMALLPAPHAPQVAPASRAPRAAPFYGRSTPSRGEAGMLRGPAPEAAMRGKAPEGSGDLL
jgi:hypothetical protein